VDLGGWRNIFGVKTGKVGMHTNKRKRRFENTLATKKKERGTAVQSLEHRGGPHPSETRSPGPGGDSARSGEVDNAPKPIT